MAEGIGVTPDLADRDSDVATRLADGGRARLRPLSRMSAPGAERDPFSPVRTRDQTYDDREPTSPPLSGDSAVRPARRRSRPRGLGDLLAAQLADGRRLARLRLATDVLTLCLTAAFALLAGPGVGATYSNRWVVVVFGLVVIAMLHGRRQASDRLNASALEAFGSVLGVVSLAAMVTITIDATLSGTHAIALAVRLWLFSVVYLGGARALLTTSRRRAMRREGLAIPTLIVGAGLIGAQLTHRLTQESSYGLLPVGYLDADPLPRPDGDRSPVLPVLGGPDDLEDAVARTGARHVILSFSSGPDHMLVSVVRRCEQLGIGISLVPRLYESINERTSLDHVGGLPLLTLHSIDPKGWQFAVKHTFDRTAALLGLLAVSPVMLAVAAAVRLSSPGPILFRQRRVGRDGHAFDVLKFRTMLVAPSSLGTSSVEFLLPDGVAPGGVEGADRRTRIGRLLRDTSLDELPQLLNVVRGDMSLVGPRPERPEYVARFARDVGRYEDRHRVKSGITGWAQVHGLRGQTSIADRVEWDNWYILNWSLRLDFRILALTVAEILRFRET